MYLGRYAPSPTGDLHLGNVLACLAAWVRARRAGGRILLRMEDLDTPRVIAGSAHRIVEDLSWLGFVFDEQSVQSERLAHYERALDALRAAGSVFACRCSRRDIREAASAPHGSGPVYPGTCRGLGLPFDDDALAWRYAPPPGDVRFVDALAGEFAQAVTDEVGAFVVRRRDGVVAYHLAVVVDDALQGVTEVVRGRDLLDSTPRQIQLFEALGHAPPAFAHAPLLVDDEGRRLAKRDGDRTLGALRAAGHPPEHVLGWLGEALGASEGAISLAALTARVEDQHLSQPTVRLPASSG